LQITQFVDYCWCFRHPKKAQLDYCSWLRRIMTTFRRCVQNLLTCLLTFNLYLFQVGPTPKPVGHNICRPSWYVSTSNCKELTRILWFTSWTNFSMHAHSVAYPDKKNHDWFTSSIFLVVEFRNSLFKHIKLEPIPSPPILNSPLKPSGGARIFRLLEHSYIGHQNLDWGTFEKLCVFSLLLIEAFSYTVRTNTSTHVRKSGSPQ